jgi:predicted glutamine amidotransferase
MNPTKRRLETNMCGIFGVHSNKPQADERLTTLLPLLAIFMESRGSHSWGWTDGKEIVKDTGPIHLGLNPLMYKSPICMGHTRYATVGAQTKENAHPWTFGEGEDSLIGMHNGAVYNHDELNEKYNRKYAVDSMHLFQHLIEKRTMSDVRGYGALAFLRNGKLFLSKFGAGQLAVAETDVGVVFASTMEAVFKSCALSGIKITLYYNLVEDELYYAENEVLWKTKIKFDFDRSRYSNRNDTRRNYRHGTRASNYHDDEFNYQYHGYGQKHGSFTKISGCSESSDSVTQLSEPRGRWLSSIGGGQRWEEGKFINNKFIRGIWDGAMFKPEAQSLKEYIEKIHAEAEELKKKKNLEATRSESKVIVQEEQDENDSCAMCSAVFDISDITWDTPRGELCDTCADSFYKLDQSEATIESDLPPEAPPPALNTSDLPAAIESDKMFDQMTADELIIMMNKAKLTSANIPKDARLLPCDECGRVLKGSMEVRVAHGDTKIHWVFCESCYHDLSTPWGQKPN